MTPSELWTFLPIGYVLTILIETPILVLLLSSQHPLKRKLFAGLWLTACTYPIVVLVLPLLLAGYSRAAYLLVAETFAPVAECILFWLAFGKKTSSRWRDLGAIVVANLASFGAGEVFNAYDWLGVFG